MSELQLREMPPTPDPELVREYAKDTLAGTLIHMFEVHETTTQLGMVYLPVSLGALDGYTPEQIQQLVVFAVQGKHATLGMQVNGWPVFGECVLWCKQDFVAMLQLALRMQDALDAVT